MLRNDHACVTVGLEHLVNWKSKQILYRFNCITQSSEVVGGTFY